MSYTVRIEEKAQRQISALPVSVQDRVIDAIDRLKVNPRPSGSKKLKGRTNEYRVRVGDYASSTTSTTRCCMSW